MAAAIDGEDRVMATAQKIVKSLNTSKDVTDDMILIFSSFDNRLSNISDLISGDPISLQQSHDRFDAAENLILGWNQSSHSHRSLCWDEATEYLYAIDDILSLTKHLSPHGADIADRSDKVIQLAMALFEEEFRSILTQNALPLDSDELFGTIRRVSLSFVSQDGDILGDMNCIVEGDPGRCCYHERGPSLGDCRSVELVNFDAVMELKEIADRMISSRYEKECCQVYSTVRREILSESLANFGAEKLSIDEIQKIDWRSLDEKMKKWIQVLKIVVRVLLPGEKRLCEQLFHGSLSIRDACFMETAKGCMMQLLNFGQAVSIGRRSSEKLFRILDMYDAMSDVLPDLETMFLDLPGDDFLCSEAKGVISVLGEAAMGTFAEFESAVHSETSRKPVQGGEIHPLTRYVMNYIKLVVDYSDSLNSLLETHTIQEESVPRDSDADMQVGIVTPIGLRLLSLISSLESNLTQKSKLYDDTGMQYVFLMNNIQYIVQKVKDSELGRLLGDQWIRRRRGQVRQYATSYIRASWSKVISCLRVERISSSTTNVSKAALKERFKTFNAIFEDIYRIQTGWKVPNPQLREELRMSVSEKVVPAYRSFMGRIGHQLEWGRHGGKYVKYSADDLEKYVLDLFEGSPNILHHLRRRTG